MTDVLELRDLRVSAIVGVLAEERTRPQPLSLDLDIERPFEEAAINDDLAETTDYSTIISLAATTVTEGSFLLLETLVYRVAHEVLAFDLSIARVSVVARKLRPPVPEDIATVGARCTVQRSE